MVKIVDDKKLAEFQIILKEMLKEISNVRAWIDLEPRMNLNWELEDTARRGGGSAIAQRGIMERHQKEVEKFAKIEGLLIRLTDKVNELAKKIGVKV